MSVICPSCETRFRDPPAEALALKQLRCGKCDHTFASSKEKRIEVDAPPLAPDIADLAPGLASEGEEIRTALPVIVEDDAGEISTTPLFVDREEEVLPPLLTRGAALSMVALTLLLAVCGSVLFRQAIVQSAPAAAAYYAAIGLPVADPDLAIAGIVTSRTTTDGIAKLIVRGEIRNIADATVPIPPLNIVMRNGNRSTVYQWQASAAKSELKSGERSRFTAIASNVPGEAVDVEVTFAK